MSREAFSEVLDWLAEEREFQITKFNYDAEGLKNNDAEYWLNRFASYVQKIPMFGLETGPGIQATLKLAATVVALCEHLADEYELPKPGLPLGYFE